VGGAVSAPIAVDMTEGWVCDEYGYQDADGVWGCDCESHSFFCVACGHLEESADGKVYFYRVEDCGHIEFVCYECARDPNPNYVRLDSRGQPLPPPPGMRPREPLPPGECRVCGVELPPGHIYCTRVHAMWDRREHLADEVGR
jgi:hypothetical protein